MPQPPDWNRYLDAGVEFVAMTRTQARTRAKELVSQGQLAQEQVAGFVDDLVEESRKRTDGLLEIVRKEIQRQVKTLGIATKDDLAKLESKLAKAPKSANGKSASGKSANGTSAATVTKKAAKSATKKAAKQAKGAKKTAKAATKKAAKKSTKKAASKAAS
jgi:polyhydroxyalkanoate synthesis regulator phasin